MPRRSARSTWLCSWRSVGLIAEAMLRQGYDLALTSDEHGWRVVSPFEGRARGR